MIKISITTCRRVELQPVTAAIQAALAQRPPWNGMLQVYSPHTTAGVTVNEQADPDVAADIERALARLIPRQADYAHAEGNAAAHIQTTLVGNSTCVPVRAGQLVLGTWQGIYFCEFDGPRTRQLWLIPLPEAS